MSIVLKLNNVTKELENKVHTQKINYVNKEVRKTLKHLFMNINNKYIECIEYLRKNIDSSKSKSRNGDINTKQTHATSIQKRKILSALHFFKIRNEMFSYKHNAKLLEDTLNYTNKINSSFFIISKILSKNKLMFIYRSKISCFFQRILYLYRENTLKNQIMQQEILTLNRLSARTTKEQEKIKQIILMSNIERKLYKLSINIHKCSIYVSKKNDSSYSLYLRSEKKRNIEKKLGNFLYRILETSFLHLKKRRKIDKLNQEVQHKLLLILKLFTNRLEMSALKKLNFSSTEVQISDDTSYRKEYLNFKILRTFLSLRKAIQYLKERFNSEVSESFIFVLSKGSLENDRRFMGLVDSTLKDIEKYDDPVVIRMGIQFILAKKYIGDIIFLKEQTELKQSMIFSNRIK